MNRTGLLLFLSLLLVYLATASGHIDSGDGQIIFDVSRSLLEDGDVAVAPSDQDQIAYDAQGRPLGKASDLGIVIGYSVRGRNGDSYSVTGIGHSALLVPLLALGKLLDRFALFEPPPQGMMHFVSAMLFNSLVSAAGGVLVYLIGLRLTFSSARSAGLVIIYAFGTMTWVYAKSSFSDPLVGFFLILTFYGLLSYRVTCGQTWLWLGGASLGLAALTKPAGVINIPVFFAYLIFITKDQSKPILLSRLFTLGVFHLSWRGKKLGGTTPCYAVHSQSPRPAALFDSFEMRLFAFGLPIAIGVGGVLAYNWWRFESVFDTGYRNAEWTFPFWLGLYGLIASPGRGYLLYNPVIIAAIAGAFIFWRRHKLELGVIAGIVVINLLFLAKYNHWHGGGSWGPRLLLPLTPFVILPLGSLLESIPKKSVLNLLLAGIITLSVIVQIPGIFVNDIRFLQKVYNLSVDKYYQRVTFEIPYSPLMGQWIEVREVVGNFRDPTRRAKIAQLALQKEADRTMDVLSVNLPDFWFIYFSFIRNDLQQSER